MRKNLAAEWAVEEPSQKREEKTKKVEKKGSEKSKNTWKHQYLMWRGRGAGTEGTRLSRGEGTKSPQASERGRMGAL